MRTGLVDRGEEGKPHDMVPMGMRQKDFRPDAISVLLDGGQMVPQLAQPRPRVNDDPSANRRQHQLQTGCIAAISGGGGARARDRASDSPEL